VGKWIVKKNTPPWYGLSGCNKQQQNITHSTKKITMNHNAQITGLFPYCIYRHSDRTYQQDTHWRRSESKITWYFFIQPPLLETKVSHIHTLNNVLLFHVVTCTVLPHYDAHKAHLSSFYEISTLYSYFLTNLNTTL
jgi:hypothetical protein